MDLVSILNTITNVPSGDITAFLSFTGAGAGISYVLQLLRHYKGWTSFTNDLEKHATLYSRIALSVLSFVVAGAEYILNHGQGPVLSTILKHFAFLLTAAHFVYWCTTQPAYAKVTKLLNDAENYRAMTAPQLTSNTNTAAVSTTAANGNVFPD